MEAKNYIPSTSLNNLTSIYLIFCIHLVAFPVLLLAVDPLGDVALLDRLATVPPTPGVGLEVVADSQHPGWA